MTMGKALDLELAVYRRSLKEWENREGEYVLIKGEEICGFFSSYDDALKIGYEKFGLEPFLVKQISVIGKPINVLLTVSEARKAATRLAGRPDGLQLRRCVEDRL